MADGWGAADGIGCITAPGGVVRALVEVLLDGADAGWMGVETLVGGAG